MNSYLSLPRCPRCGRDQDDALTLPYIKQLLADIAEDIAEQPVDHPRLTVDEVARMRTYTDAAAAHVTRHSIARLRERLDGYCPNCCPTTQRLRAENAQEHLDYMATLAATRERDIAAGLPPLGGDAVAITASTGAEALARARELITLSCELGECVLIEHEPAALAGLRAETRTDDRFTALDYTAFWGEREGSDWRVHVMHKAR